MFMKKAKERSWRKRKRSRKRSIKLKSGSLAGSPKIEVRRFPRYHGAMKALLVIFTGCVILAGCAQVNLNTPEPLQVDVKMKVDVENKGGLSAKAEESPLSAAEERRMLSHQVQELKNDRKAGEGRDGLLVLKEVPKDPTYADYAKSVVAKENAAREKLFAEKAEVEGKTAKEYAKEFAERAREGSYPGEWVQADDGKWKKK
ncbi:DUF1318 domain-containing protein [bacterium]|nr:DUF1318 domain-containing protein [bacterium]